MITIYILDIYIKIQNLNDTLNIPNVRNFLIDEIAKFI